MFMILLLSLVYQDVGLAKEFEDLVKKDDRFTIVGKVVLGLVCFRLKVSKLYIHRRIWY